MVTVLTCLAPPPPGSEKETEGVSLLKVLSITALVAYLSGQIDPWTTSFYRSKGAKA